MASSGYIIPSLKRGQDVEGKVIAVTKGDILIDVGGKSEGVITGREFAASRDIIATFKAGDSITATVIYPENDAGQVVLSLRKLSGDRRWQELEEKRKNGEDIEVLALEVNRGGVICEYFDLRGFLPSSQLAQMPAKLEELIGKHVSVRVIEVDRNTNRLIFSQKQPGKQDLEKILKKLAHVKIGEKYQGIVTAVLPFGIFVEITLEGQEGKRKPSKSSEPSESSQPSKLEGLVHVSEISWEKIEDATGMFNVGDKLEVVVIAKDETSGRLNLSLKQLMPDPFVEASSHFAQDEEIRGTVARVTPYGVFVTLEANIEGLIHISKIPPEVEFKEGQKVECTIESIDTKARKISLVPIVKEKPVLYR